MVLHVGLWRKIADMAGDWAAIVHALRHRLRRHLVGRVAGERVTGHNEFIEGKEVRSVSSAPALRDRHDRASCGAARDARQLRPFQVRPIVNMMLAKSSRRRRRGLYGS